MTAGVSLIVAATLARPDPGDQTRALYRWNDSLLIVQNVAALRGFESASDLAPTWSGARREAYVMRRAELTGDHGDLDWIIQRAGWESDLDRTSAWGPYLLARAYAAMARTGWEPIRSDDGKDITESYADATWRTLADAIHRRGNFNAARALFVALLVPGGDRLLRPEQRAVLSAEVQRAGPDPDALLVWGRYLRTLRQYDSALAAFDRSAALGGDASRLGLERARTLRALHDTTSASNAYWDGVNHLTRAGREAYRYDLAWLVDADSLKVFDAVPDSSVPAWMHQFWDQRDAAAANHPGERLDEHLRRWDVAFARYRVRSPWRRTMYTAIDPFYDNTDCVHRDSGLYDLLWKMPPAYPGDMRDHEWLLDNRGIMYLRHGDPIERIGGWGPQLGREDFITGPPADLPDTSPTWSQWALGLIVSSFYKGEGNPHAGVARMSGPGTTESWLYNIDGDRVLLNFRGSDAIGMYDATTLSSFLPYSPFGWLARSGTLPEYHAAGERIAAEMSRPNPGMNPPTCWNEVRTAIAKGRSDATMATHHDSDAPPLVTPWASATRMFALGTAAEHSSEVLITFGLGGPIAADTLASGEFVYPIHFRVVAWERNTGQTVTVDSLRQFVLAHALQPTERITSWLEIPLPAGDWQIATRATQQHDSAGAITLEPLVRVDRGAALALSDLVTGIAGSPQWRAPDGAFFPVNVINIWPAGRNVELYFEVHGLAAGASYHSVVAVAPVNGNRQQTIRAETSDHATGVMTSVRRVLGVASLAPGRYRLSVTVQANGKTAHRVQTLELEPATGP